MPLVIERHVWATPHEPAGGTNDGDKERLFLHHTVAPNRSYTKAGERRAMRELYAMHKARGFSDIGYTYVVFRSGRIYKARPVNRIPAANEGWNTGCIAIAVQGTNPVLQLLQRRQIRKLTVTLKARHGLGQLGGHRDVGATECPGDRIYGWIQKWRRDFKMEAPHR